MELVVKKQITDALLNGIKTELHTISDALPDGELKTRLDKVIVSLEMPIAQSLLVDKVKIMNEENLRGISFQSLTRIRNELFSLFTSISHSYKLPDARKNDLLEAFNVFWYRSLCFFREEEPVFSNPKTDIKGWDGINLDLSEELAEQEKAEKEDKEKRLTQLRNLASFIEEEINRLK